MALSACAAPLPDATPNTTVSIPNVSDRALSWHAPAYADEVYGLRPLMDGPPTRSVTLAITRVVLRTNPKLAPLDALGLAEATVRAARTQALSPEFLAATLLQESAFDPQALSSAGALGIAQFMPETAQGAGIDPFDPYDAIGGAASLLGSYARAYDGLYAYPLTAAVAAYNAGPGAVAEYHGIPPYAETRAYVNDVIDRWAKITAAETPIRAP
jgi:soluble lytic murein transglycosylase-like protein